MYFIFIYFTIYVQSYNQVLLCNEINIYKKTISKDKCTMHRETEIYIYACKYFLDTKTFPINLYATYYMYLLYIYY